MQTISFIKCLRLTITLPVVMCLLSVGFSADGVYAQNSNQLERSLDRTERAINKQERKIEGTKKELEANKTRLKNAKARYNDNRLSRRANPESQSIANATTRSFDDVIRAENAVKKTEKRLKEEETALHTLEIEEARLKGETKKAEDKKRTAPTLDEVIEAGTIPDFLDILNINNKNKYKNKANESNKEDRAIESENRGGVIKEPGISQNNSHSPSPSP